MINLIRQDLGNFISNRIIDYLRKDPFGRLDKMIRFATLLDLKKKHGKMLEMTHRKVTDRNSRWSKFYASFFTDLDKKGI